MPAASNDPFVGPCDACGKATLRASDAVWSGDGYPFCRGCLPAGAKSPDMHAALRLALPVMRKAAAGYLSRRMLSDYDTNGISPNDWAWVRPDFEAILAAEACVGRVPDDWPWLDAIIDSGKWREQP